ncbi:MAG: hypothetical protein FalmKO_36960 [Falsiruegeria mediterranea]
MIRRLLLTALLAVPSGCGVAVYTPVVGAALLGQDSVDVESQRTEGRLVGQTLSVPANSRYALRQFSSGTVFLAFDLSVNGTRLLCPMAGQKLVVTRVYDDKVNGGRFYDAEVDCTGTSQTVRRNHWSPDLLEWSHSS